MRIGKRALPYAIVVALLAWTILSEVNTVAQHYWVNVTCLTPSADVSLRRVGKRVPRPIVRKRRKS